jgi:hypothetical protein
VPAAGHAALDAESVVRTSRQGAGVSTSRVARWLVSCLGEKVWIGDSPCWAKVVARAGPTLGAYEVAATEAQGRRVGAGPADWDHELGYIGGLAPSEKKEAG